MSVLGAKYRNVHENALIGLQASSSYFHHSLEKKKNYRIRHNTVF